MQTPDFQAALHLAALHTKLKRMAGGMPLASHLPKVVPQGVEHAVQHQAQEQQDEAVQVVRRDDALLRQVRQRARALQHHLSATGTHTFEIIDMSFCPVQIPISDPIILLRTPTWHHPDEHWSCGIHLVEHRRIQERQQVGCHGQHVPVLLHLSM